MGNAGFKQALKEDLARDYIDLLEVRSEEDAVGYREVVFPEIGWKIPIVACSDCHGAAAYSRATQCWVRADPTLAGLRQVMIEPEDRVFLGERPPLLERVSQRSMRHATRIAIGKVEESALDETWFDCVLEVNPGLVAIIGRKGGGKSALAEIVGSCGDTQHEEHFSFLNSGSFRRTRGNKAQHFAAELTWASGDSVVNPDDHTDPGPLGRGLAVWTNPRSPEGRPPRTKGSP